MTIKNSHHNPHIVLLDNFDSFTYNLVDQFRSLGFPVTVYRNNLSAQHIEHALLEHENPVLVLSPGPVLRLMLGACQPLFNRLRVKFRYWGFVLVIKRLSKLMVVKSLAQAILFMVKLQ